ncbi:MAG: hypothetical protein IK107_03340 [Oscillospiraceae bacterium]|nr:hypothetical protein [Oscillospiraceae bacterium]
MKKCAAASVLLSALLLTACGGQQSSAPDSPAETVQTTATETAAETTETATTAAETTTTSAETTQSTASTAAETTTASTSASTTGTTAASSAVSGTATAAVTLMTDMTAAQAITTANKADVVSALDEAPLPKDVEKVLVDFFDGIVQNDREKITQSSNFNHYVTLMAVTGSQNIEKLTEDMLQALANSAYAKYEISFTAHRPDLQEFYEKNVLPNAETNLQDQVKNKLITSEQADTMRKLLQGASDFYSAEVTLTDSKGTGGVIGIPIVKQNGAWCVDLMFSQIGEMPLTRAAVNKEVNRQAMYAAFAFTHALNEFAIANISTEELENKEYFWKEDKLKNAGSADSTDLMEKMQFYVHDYEPGISEFTQIRFLLKDGACYAFAGKLKDGRCPCWPETAAGDVFNSLDAAFSAAKVVADYNAQQTN